jgi:cephalosporin hydroxylase
MQIRTWNNIHGFFAAQKFYEDVFQWLEPNASFVQLGSLYGRSIAWVATRAKQTNKPLKIISIDHGVLFDITNPAKQKFVKVTVGPLVDNLRRCGVLSMVTHIVHDSAKSAYLFADNSLEFVFVDADHRYDAVKRDLNAWMPKIKIGGILAGDDYNSTYPGVTKGVFDIFGFHCPATDYKEDVWAVVKQVIDGKEVFVPLQSLPEYLKPKPVEGV